MGGPAKHCAMAIQVAAGPPTATSGDDPAESASQADSEGPSAPDDQSEAGAEHEHLLHVPIKKKGSRKR